jgi:hypothetical protein
LIIAATADAIDKNDLFIYHSASSSRNPITWMQTTRYLSSHVTKNLPEKRISFPHFEMYQNKYLHKLVFLAKREVPAKMFYYFSQLLGNPKMKKDSERYIKALNQCKMLSEFFIHFTTHEWIYDTYNSYALKSKL